MIEFYFQQLNSLDLNDSSENIQTFNYYLQFNISVFRFDMRDFYFTSDVKVLIDVYLRILTNGDPSMLLHDTMSQEYSDSATVGRITFVTCLDGINSIVCWLGYKEEMQYYRLNEITDNLKNWITVVNDEEFNEKEIHMKNKIIKKLEIMLKNMDKVQSNAFSYSSQAVIKLPIDISEYALQTKTLYQLQKGLSFVFLRCLFVILFTKDKKKTFSIKS